MTIGFHTYEFLKSRGEKERKINEKSKQNLTYIRLNTNWMLNYEVLRDIYWCWTIYLLVHMTSCTFFIQ
jgi:hypothetical protein